MSKILVVAEFKNGEIRKPTLELLTKARQAGIPTDAALIGSGVRGAADQLAGHGAATVYLADDGALERYSSAAYLPLVTQAVEKSAATQVWFSLSETSNSLAPALAGRLDAGYVGGAAAMEIDGDNLTIHRPAMATKVMQKMTFLKDGLRIVSIRSGTFDLEPAEPVTAQTVDLELGEPDARVVVTAVVQEVQDDVDLGEASVIVSVGRGVKGPEGVEEVRPLAKLLGAGFGASRAVVDSGWMPHNTQVGQTGRVVSPDVYFSIGISGAIQHMAGMSGSKLIVAVNKDPDAPIFSIADYGIVGDLFKVVPILTEEIKKVKS
ncbi:MAG: electron transfer flavoprotein subunit alpha/FixB family protein [SAR324 cluster bacterium]|nr:electron transfer flavoprotein subunit alpha/FixB family protein [SAR324 cluster bacterium]